MSLALARKYRPKRFSDVAVQSHVTTTLQGAIAHGRVAHGYLLCGPRGVGKTTLARVLAMALNCERRDRSAESGEPCGECDSCRRIWSGAASLDVVEIDAASNRGVDDARELRERAMYAPSGDDRHKVYIIDEAHMLTREAWNTLLKILEEPPSRVIFVFATTEPQKIAQMAAPVLSRLQRFDLKRIGTTEIRDRLNFVLQAEGVTADADALAVVARAADGSMRDALSITDQVLSMGDGQLTAAAVRDALGLIPEDEFIALLDLIAERRAADVFPVVGRLADAGIDFGTFLSGFSDMVRSLLAIVLGGDASDLSDSARSALAQRKEQWRTGDLMRMLAALTELEPRFKRSGQQQLLIETTLVRFALMDRTVELEELLRSAERGSFGVGGSGGGGGGGGGAATPPRSSADSTGGAGRRTESTMAISRSEGTTPSQSPALAPPAPAPAPARSPRAGDRASSVPTVSATPTHAPTPTAVRPVPGPAAAQPVAQSTLPALDVNKVTERWDDVVAKLRGEGPTLVATALEHATPTSVTARGELTITLDAPNEFFAKAVERAAPEIIAVLRQWFAPVERIRVGGNTGAGSSAPPQRLTGEMARAHALDSLRKKDGVLAAAIDALDLEVVE